MSEILRKADYEAEVAASRDERMKWWRDARFGMIIHYGLYAQVGTCEWAQVLSNYPVEEYEKFADTFEVKPDAAKEWVKFAKAAGAKYVVLTTRHHDGFSLWDSKVNPYNSVNYGPHRDIVREFVDACREEGMRIGLYSSLMDWHHPDGWKCAIDSEARRRFLDYIEALNVELLTNYGKIDVLWYDVAQPLQSWDSWESHIRNQRLREIQPDIIINNRSQLPEDFDTPEEHVDSSDRDWEACMTFNGISWGYVDEEQAKPFNYTTQRVIKMLNKCCREGGNLLMNLGPRPDGSIPGDIVEPLHDLGKWLERNGEAVYGRKLAKWNVFSYTRGGNGISDGSCSEDGKTVYIWCWIWPKTGQMYMGGYMDKPEKVTILGTGQEVEFEHDGQRILFKGLPETCPDPLGIAVLKVEFKNPPKYIPCSRYPQLSQI